MPARIAEATELQARVARAVVETGTLTAAAAKSGVALSYCCKLMQDPAVQAAVHAEMRRRLATAAPVALTVLITIVRDEAANPRVRVDAAKAILDRAGFGPPKVAAAGAEKALNEMTTGELRELADRLERELADRAKPVNAQDAVVEPVEPTDILD